MAPASSRCRAQSRAQSCPRIAPLRDLGSRALYSRCLGASRSHAATQSTSPWHPPRLSSLRSTSSARQSRITLSSNQPTGVSRCIGCLPLITCLRLNVMRVHAIGGLAAHGLSRVPTQHSGQWHSYQRVALHRGSRGRQHRSIQVDHQGRGWTCAVHVQGGGHRALHHRGARSTWESRELPAARPGQVRLQSNCRWTRRGEQPAHGMHFGSSSHWSMHERRH